MPEMPEVETIRTIIEPQVIGRRIVSVDINHPSVIAHPEPAAFAAALTGQTFAGMSRRGKCLTLHLQNGDRVVLHLKMTGQLLVTPADFPAEKHTHMVMPLSDGNEVRYIDVRRFGRFWYFEKDEADTLTGQNKLGPEPCDDALTPDYLKVRLGRCKKAIKDALHDQAVVAGIGNIYSDEILFSACINPCEKCMNLSDEDWERLAFAMRDIMTWAIDVNRMTPAEYLEGKGKEYRNMPDLRAYGRAGQACVRCGAVMESVVVGGRHSCFCPVCQKPKG